MIVLKCRMCGANITPESGKTYAACEYCGSVMTLPHINDERIANLFNRATHYRLQHEFEKAQATYENILMEDEHNAEAYWGIILSVFGIEYVEDPQTKNRIPTCNRVQRLSVLKNLNYQKAVEYAADDKSRMLYEQEANEIAKIQKGILSISDQEDSYDIFICYKETDPEGNRTLDSTLAQDIYTRLKKEGYRVFFSRLTLEDKAGTEYEPYIFAALNSAKIMLVVGTKPEYFNAVWVKNEWLRFLALIEDNKDKVMIPCYREMDAYEIPEELAVFQAQDMGKIGFAQDLLHGIQKILTRFEEKKAISKSKESGSINHNDIETLRKRAYVYIEDDNKEDAKKLFERILNADSENADAYIGMLVLEIDVKKAEDIPRYGKDISKSAYFKTALRYADESQKATLAEYQKSTAENEKLLASYYESSIIARDADELIGQGKRSIFGCVLSFIFPVGTHLLAVSLGTDGMEWFWLMVVSLYILSVFLTVFYIRSYVKMKNDIVVHTENAEKKLAELKARNVIMDS